MAHLLSSTFSFKKIISPNFFKTYPYRQKKSFSNQFFIHKRKKISKSVNKHYIFAKILNFNDGKKSPCNMPH